MNKNFNQWTDAKGNPVAVVGKGESFTDAVADRLDREGKLDQNMVGASLGRILRYGGTRNKAFLHDPDIAALGGEGVAFNGGYLVPHLLDARFLDLVRAKSFAFQAGLQTFEMQSEGVTLARLATDPAMEVKAENAAFSDASITFGSMGFYAKTIGCYYTASAELVMDAPNFEQIIENTLATALAQEIDRLVLLGDTSPWNGIDSNPGCHEETSVGTPSDYTEMLAAWTDLATSNANTDNLSWFVHPRDAATFFALQESTSNQYLSPPSPIAKAKQFVTPKLPTNRGGGTNESIMILGDFSSGLYGIRLGTTIDVTTQAGETHKRFQVGFRVVTRADFGLMYPDHFSVLRGVTA